MTDIATRLRQTRADMIGTDDEQHYWDCHDAAVEIDRLRLELSVQKACTVAGREEIARLRAKTLFPKERRTLAWAATYVERSTFKNQAATLRSLLERPT
jgi:hypothetical protein